MLDIKQRGPATENSLLKYDIMDKEEIVHQECPAVTTNIESEKEKVYKRGTEGKPRYEDIYRCGNFGVTLGRINTTIGKKMDVISRNSFITYIYSNNY